MKSFRAYWGYLALAGLVVAWERGVAFPMLLVLSLAVFSYASFQAPGWCGAANRDGVTYCRQNARGLLRGCAKKQHRWQKMQLIFYRTKAGNIVKAIFPSPKEKFNAFLAVGGLISAMTAAIVPIFKG